MIYIVRAGASGPVKIGFTDTLATRLIKMQVDNHEALTVVRLLIGDEADEVGLHRRFADLRIRGEWFSFSREMLGDLGLPDFGLPAKEEFILPVLPPWDAKFHERLVLARRASHMTQAELAARLDVPRSIVAGWEAGNNTPLVSRIHQVAAALGVTTDWLLVSAAGDTHE